MQNPDVKALKAAVVLVVCAIILTGLGLAMTFHLDCERRAVCEFAVSAVK